jgi:hypothetical protein
MLKFLTTFATVALSAAFAGAALGQASAAPAAPVLPGPAGEVQRSYAAVKANILKSAEKMPATEFGFKPTPDVRTFARVVNHISEAQLRSCGIANGTKETAKVPAETADKAAIVEALKASFAECDKAYGSASDATLMDPLAVSPTAKRSRIGLLWGNVSHDNEQYATLALYMRLKGLAPPSSEK